MIDAGSSDSHDANASLQAVLTPVQRWLEQGVIGLNLCPFARAVHVKGQIRWVVLSGVSDPEDLRQHVRAELQHLAGTQASQIDTTLIILPDALADFVDFGLFVEGLNPLLKREGLKGVLQIASFHPQFEFAGEDPASVSHYTNRSPYPVIHLLREASMSAAIEKFGDTDRIWQSNIDRLASMSASDLEQVFPHGNWTAKP